MVWKNVWLDKLSSRLSLVALIENFLLLIFFRWRFSSHSVLLVFRVSRQAAIFSEAMSAPRGRFQTSPSLKQLKIEYESGRDLINFITCTRYEIDLNVLIAIIHEIRCKLFFFLLLALVRSEYKTDVIHCINCSCRLSTFPWAVAWIMTLVWSKATTHELFFCSTSFPLASTRWIWSTFSSHFPLSSDVD